MRARIYLFLGARSGVGRTTTALAFAHALQRRGRKTLLVDLDPDCHASLALSVDADRVSGETGTTAEILRAWLDEKPAPALESLISETPLRAKPSAATLSVLPGSLHNRSLRERLPFRHPGRLWLDDPALALAEALRPAFEQFQAVVIDVPVGLDLLVVNALTVATDLIWVDTPDGLWGRGVRPLWVELQALLANRDLNPEQHGILPSRCRGTPDEANRMRRGLRDTKIVLLSADVPEVVVQPDLRYPGVPTAWRESAVVDALRWLVQRIDRPRMDDAI